MLTLFLAVALGWFGSLLVNYLSDVLPKSRSISKPACDQCRADLPIQFYILNQPCPACGARPSRRHWIVFILGPVLACLNYYLPAPVLGVWGGILWLAYFGLVVVIDVEHRLILHPVSLAGAVLGIIFGAISHGVPNTLLGGGAGFGIMLVFYILGNVFIGFLSRSRGEQIDEVALGFGDVNLAGVIGLLLGWPGVVAGVFLAVVVGGIVSGLFLLIQLLRKKYQAFEALPYGPFLVISVILLLYFSQFVR